MVPPPASLNRVAYRKIPRFLRQSRHEICCCSKILAPNKKKSYGVNSESFSAKSIGDIVSAVHVQPASKGYWAHKVVVDEFSVKRRLSVKDIMGVLTRFAKSSEVSIAAEEFGMDASLFNRVFSSFRHFCLESNPLPLELHILLHDVIIGNQHVHALFPYFQDHAKQVFPHLDCMEDLRKVSDLSLPPNWYPEARSIQRRIIYHAGPTNSGKTHSAIEAFKSADRGVYCGPLRLLAAEVYQKMLSEEIPCDLITGEDRRYANSDESPANHTSSTVEMLNTANEYDVAIIDEIQMMRDLQRGFAWTRALLGVWAHEVHLCGEPAGIDLVSDLLNPLGEVIEVRHYERLTSLTIGRVAVRSTSNIQPGDCIVCFSRMDIFSVSRLLANVGIRTALVYGALSPGAKLAQAAKFNDPHDPCNVLVATDAIGMGLNLCIKRMIFYNLFKPTLCAESGEVENRLLSPHQAVQIAGRAGRFGSRWPDGEMTTFHQTHHRELCNLLNAPTEPIKQAGLAPTADRIEMLSYYLPKASLVNLLDIFAHVSQVDHRYFLCDLSEERNIAEAIEHVPLPIRTRYVFCLCPAKVDKSPFIASHLVQFAERLAKGLTVSADWLCKSVGWPIAKPRTQGAIAELEDIFDLTDVYLWLGYRFPDTFNDMDAVRELRESVDQLIQDGILYLVTQLLKAANDSKIREPTTSRKVARKGQENLLSYSQQFSNLSKQGRKARKALASGTVTLEQLQKLHDEIDGIQGRRQKHKRRKR